MTVVVYFIGALLVVLGAAFVALGVPIVRMEIGWSEVIGGSVAASAGFVVLALGVVVKRLEDLQRTILGLNLSVPWREPVGDEDTAWEPAATEPAYAPHPLAPAPTQQTAVPVVEAVPSTRTEEEPIVQPEPLLVEAPLHPPIAPALEPEPDPEVAAVRLEEGAPALLGDEDHAPTVSPVEPVPSESLSEPAEAMVDPLPGRPADIGRGRSNFLATFLARRSAATAPEAPARPREPSATEPMLVLVKGRDNDLDDPFATPVDLSSGWKAHEPVHHMPSGSAAEPVIAAEEPTKVEEGHDPDDVAVAAAPADDRETDPEPSMRLVEAEPPTGAPPPAPDPVIVGRYNAGSASYVMYSNGMIQVETEGGTHQFASMQELKSFIERRDAAKV